MPWWALRCLLVKIFLLSGSETLLGYFYFFCRELWHLHFWSGTETHHEGQTLHRCGGGGRWSWWNRHLGSGLCRVAAFRITLIALFFPLGLSLVSVLVSVGSRTDGEINSIPAPFLLPLSVGEYPRCWKISPQPSESRLTLAGERKHFWPSYRPARRHSWTLSLRFLPLLRLQEHNHICHNYIN